MARVLLVAYEKANPEQIWAKALGESGLAGLEVCAFMGREEGALSALFPGAERVPIHSYLGPQDRDFPGPEAVGAFSDLSTKTSFPSFLVTMQTTLNRYDQSGSFRNIDREVIIRQTALRFLQVLKKHRIEAILFDHVPHSFESLMMHSLGKELNLPRLYFETVKYAPVGFPLMEIGADRRFLAEDTDVAELRNLSSQSAEITRSSLEAQIKGMSIDSDVPSYMAFTVTGKKKQKMMERLKALTPNRYNDYTFFPSLKSLPSMLRHLGTRFLTGAYRSTLLRVLQEEGEAGKEAEHVISRGDFALFALQYEPERTSLPEGLPVLHQLDALVEARRILSETIPLYVKEHPSQLHSSKEGVYNGRSPFFYGVVKSLNNTYLLGSGPLAKQMVRSASVVFTLTGTIAVEAALRKVPAIYFGFPWWSGMPGSRKIGVGEIAQEEVMAGLPSPVAEKDILDFFLERLTNFGIPFASELGSDAKLNHSGGSNQGENHLQLASISALRVVLQIWLSRVEGRGA